MGDLPKQLRINDLPGADRLISHQDFTPEDAEAGNVTHLQLTTGEVVRLVLRESETHVELTTPTGIIVWYHGTTGMQREVSYPKTEEAVA